MGGAGARGPCRRRDELLADIGIGGRLAAVVAARSRCWQREAPPAEGEPARRPRSFRHAVVVRGTRAWRCRSRTAQPDSGDAIVGHMRRDLAWWCSRWNAVSAARATRRSGAWIDLQWARLAGMYDGT